MEYETIQLDAVVFAALDSLKQPLREEVLHEIYDLINDPEGRPNVRRIDWEGAQYELKPSADRGLRVYFRINDALRLVEVIDVIRPQALRSILAGGGPSKPLS